MPEGIDRFELADAGLVATFAAKVVYVYASTDPGHEGLLKIGDATARGLSDIDGLPPNSEPLNSAAEARIRSYTRTQGAAWQLLHAELAIRTIDGKRGGFRDYDVHAVLRNSGIEQVRPNGSTSREWFRTDLETAVKAIAAVKHGHLSLGAGEVSTGRTPFAPRPEQDRFIKETIRAFKHADRYLWNAKMRFGKTVTALELVRRMKFKKTIIVTHRPVVNKGWFEDFRDKVFVRPDDNYVYGSKDMAASLDEICGHGARNLVYFASIQDLRGSSAVGGRFEKNDEIFATRWDCVIVDEAHEGTRTALGEAVIRRLFPEKRDYPAKLLALSGTPFNILDSYREGVSTWDYVMEQAAKRDWPLLHGGDSNARLSDSNRGSGGDDSDRRAAMGALLNFCPVISIRGSVMRRFDSDALMQELKRAFAVRAIMSGFADDSIYDDDNFDAAITRIHDFRDSSDRDLL